MQNQHSIALIYLPLKLSTAYAYKYSTQNFILNIGDLVKVPLQNKQVYGIVVELNYKIDFNEAKLKEVIEKVDDIFSISPNLISFLKKFASYNIVNFGNVLKLAINVSGFSFNQTQDNYILNEEALKNYKATNKQQEIIDFLQNTENNTQDITKNFSKNIINTLVKNNILIKEKIKKQYIKQQELAYNPSPLNKNQEEIAQGLIKEFSNNDFGVSVLSGVPGSGKTEVYFSAINAVLKQGKQVLILLPEIALSNQLLLHFKSRFGVEPYIWHSNISKSKKQQVWVGSINDNLKIVIGARSALFLPFSNLGLIVVDEEHDTTYKQEESVIYNARDMAVLRAKIENIPIMLVSATPSLETINNIKLNKYKYFNLNARYNQLDLPDIEIINMKEENLARGEIFSKKVLEQINNTLQKNQQVLIFANKRGYNHNLFCKTCKEKMVCKNCSLSLVHHKSKNLLLCHYCGFSVPYTNSCPLCLTQEPLINYGVGVEKIEEEVERYFKNYKSIVLSSDTMNSLNQQQENLTKINNNEYSILIGTQVVAKGYNFKHLTLVVVLDADFNNLMESKASEKAWQLLYQVAGRAGRFEQKGAVIMQSYDINNFLLQSLVKKDYNNFIDALIKTKKQGNMPPFVKWVSVVVLSKDKNLLSYFCNYLAKIKLQSNASLLGPIEAPISLLAGFYRQRFLVKVALNENIQKAVENWLLDVKVPSNIKMQIDVDPISFY